MSSNDYQFDIDVDTRFLDDQSAPEDDRYVFAYHITIQNRSPETVTLRRRYWEITDAHGRLRTVEGTGVVGEQPCLAPGEIFEYSSSAILDAPWGKMSGRYLFEHSPMAAKCGHPSLPSRSKPNLPCNNLKK